MMVILSSDMEARSSKSGDSEGKKRFFYIATCSCFYIFSLVLFSLLFNACSDEENSVAFIGKMNITGADGLFVGKISTHGSAGGRISSVKGGDGEQRLFKVTSDGYIEEVTFEDKNGDVVHVSNAPTSVIDTNGEFVFVGFNEVSYIVRKTDGAAFTLGQTQVYAEGSIYQTGPYVVSDDSGNIYFMGRQLFKVDVSDPQHPIQVIYSARGDQIFGFAVDKDGNAGYSGTDAANLKVIRCRKNSGGFELLPGDGSTFWSGLDRHLYYFDGLQIWKVTFDPFILTKYGNPLYVGCGFESFLEIKNKDVIIAVGGCSYVYHLYSEAGITKNIPYSDFNLSSVKTSAATDDHYYLAGTSLQGKGVLLKVDPTTNEYSEVVSGGYDIYKVSPTASNKVLINAMRLSDGKIVLAQIEEDGTVNTLEESLDEEVTLLTRVN